MRGVGDLVSEDMFVDIMEEEEMDEMGWVVIDEGEFLNYKEIRCLCSVVDSVEMGVIC